MWTLLVQESVENLICFLLVIQVSKQHSVEMLSDAMFFSDMLLLYLFFD